MKASKLTGCKPGPSTLLEELTRLGPENEGLLAELVKGRIDRTASSGR